MKNYVKLTRMGMKDSQQAEKALTASGRAAFELGMDADSTAELFGQWTQELGLGDRQITAMTRSMRDTARTTGLMGDSLAKAVHSSKVMMDYLRNINSLTSSSADNVLKLTAAGQKFGVGEQVGEFQKLLAGGPARAAMGGSKYFTLFQRILDKSGLRGKFNAGEDILGDEKLVAQFGKGLEKEFAAFEKMSKQGQAVFAHSMGMEIGELKQVVKAWKESISGKNMEDIEKKIKAQKDVLANAEKLGNKLQINAAKDQLFGLQSQHVDKILRDQTTAFDKRGAKGVSDAELQKAADEINEMAKGAGLGTQLEPGALAGKSAEEKLQLLENTNEQVRAEISKMRSPQQQANQWLEKIYDWLAKFGTGAAPNIHPAVAFGAGIFGKQLASWGLNAGRALWNGRAGAAGAEAAGAGGAGVRGAAGGVRGAAGAGGVRGAAAGAGGIRGAGGAAGAGSRFGRAGAALGRGLGAAGRGLGGVGRVAMGAGKLAGRLATPVAMALGAYEGAATSTNDWDARRPENLKDWGGWDYASKAGDIASMSTGDFVQIGKRQYESYQSNAAVRKTESERKIDKMGMADRQKQLAGLDDPKKLEELQNQKANLTRLRGGAENNIKQLEKNKGSWFNPLNWWANNSDNAMIEGDKGRITAYDKELKDIDDQLGKMSAATSGASIDTLREERAAQAKADVESESTKQLTDVASNTGSAVDALTSMQTTLSEILEELRTSNTSPDTSPNAKGSVAPDYGRQVSNTRSGSINRNMSYTQQT
jgi:hypothetical protein